jgi:hypothetical protein
MFVQARSIPDCGLLHKGHAADASGRRAVRTAADLAGHEQQAVGAHRPRIAVFLVRHVSRKLRVFIDWIVELMAGHAPVGGPPDA